MINIYIMLTNFGVLLIPLLIATAFLSLQARWAWGRTVDKVLRGMKVDAVRDKVERAEKHRTWAKRHVTVAGFFFVTSLMVSMFQTGLNSFGDVLLFLPFLWVYCVLAPHLLGLYLFHVRWNPSTLERKQKLDEEDGIYQGNYDLNPDMRYGVNEEGELVELGLISEADAQQEASKASSVL